MTDSSTDADPDTDTAAADTNADIDTAATNADTVLCLVADPGLPTELAHRLARELPSELDRRGAGAWEVRICDEAISLDAQGALPMLEIGDRVRDREEADAVVLITDLPRRAGADPVVADAGTAHRVGLVSLPALGGWFQYRRCRDTVVRLLTRDLFAPADGTRPHENTDAGSAGSLTRLDAGEGSGTDGSGVDGPGRNGPPGGTGDENSEPGSDDTGDDSGAASAEGSDESGSAGVEDEVDVRLALTGTRGRLRLLAGMVRANRPWRLVPSLSPAIAAAAAGAAFGIFYSNIWQLATAIGSWRQVVVALIALAGMTTWLIIDNSLWESRRNRSLREETILSNVSTVLTVASGVVIMFGLLFVLAVVAAVLVIPPHYLGSTLMRETGVDDYVMIALLSTSMGTVAGALGSGFADDAAVRQAAYSRREQERRARLDREDERSTGTRGTESGREQA